MNIIMIASSWIIIVIMKNDDNSKKNITIIIISVDIVISIMKIIFDVIARHYIMIT